MKKLAGWQKGMGIGGWLTNYKRFEVIPPERWKKLTIGDYEHFDTYITKRDVEYIATLGMDHVRLGFDQIVLEQKPYEYSEHIFSIIENFVKWCNEVGLNVILNLHKCEGNYLDLQDAVSLCDSEELQNRFVKFWLEFERRFANNNHVAFEILNESKEINAEKWNALIERTVRAIREKNKTRLLFLGAGAHNSASALQNMNILNDENVVYTFHFYHPHEFTHQRSVLRGSHVFYNRNMEYPGDIKKHIEYFECMESPMAAEAYKKYQRMDKEYLLDCMKGIFNLQEKYPDSVFYCSEFGVIRHCNIKYRENWIADVISIFKEHNIPYCVWNYLSTPNDGNKFSLVDDDNRIILSEKLSKIIRGETE